LKLELIGLLLALYTHISQKNNIPILVDSLIHCTLATKEEMHDRLYCLHHHYKQCRYVKSPWLHWTMYVQTSCSLSCVI